MNLLQDLRQRSEGCGLEFNYDNILSRLRCTSFNSPPSDLIDSRLLSCSFAKKQNHGHILAFACEEGQIVILDTKPSQNDTLPYHLTIPEENENAIFSVAWSDVDMKLITTCGDHAVSLWDVHADLSLCHINSFKAHRCSVKTACFRPQSSDIFASGGRDGNIYVWDARSANAEPDQYINNCHKKHGDKTDSSVTCVVFQDDYKLISCADKESNINVWDLRKTYLRSTEKPIPIYQLPSPSSRGYSHMILNKNHTKLFANCFSNNIYCYNVCSYSKIPDRTYSGHSVGNFFSKLAISPDEKYIASTDSNNKISLWGVNSPGGPVITLSGEENALNGLSDISWCSEDQLKIATSSDHPAPWIWTVPPEFNKVQQEDVVSQPVSYASQLRTKVRRCKRNSAMISSSIKTSMKQKELPCMIMLPNSVADGFQIHMCNAIERKPNLSRNWLMHLHNKQGKKMDVDNENKVPSPNTKKIKTFKRKRCSLSPCNNLTKYFKKSNENCIVQR